MREVADETVLSIVEGRTKGPRASFYMGSIEDAVASEKAARPMFKDVPFVKIFTPGDKDNIINQPAWVDERNPNAHNKRFPMEWAAFKSGVQSEYGTGTPLKEWTAISRSQVETLVFMKVFTVEDLASVSDGNLQALGAGYLALRQKAQAYLADAQKGATKASLKAELDKRDVQIAELQAALKTIEAKHAKQEK